MAEQSRGPEPVRHARASIFSEHSTGGGQPALRYRACAEGKGEAEKQAVASARGELAEKEEHKKANYYCRIVHSV